MNAPKHILAITGLLAWAVIGPAASRGDTLPQINAQPQNQMVVEGSNATFSVSATGGDLHYQWYEYGSVPIGGATSPSLKLTTDDANGSQVYNFSVMVTNLAGAVDSSNATLTVLTVLTGSINPYTPGTLGYDLFRGTFALASATNGIAYYNPNISNLGSNSAVWTWPVNLSCMGYSSDGYESALITSNKLLVCAHYGGEAGQTVTFHDTNGVAWVGMVTNVINVIADLDIAQLSNAAPASIVIPYVLPPNYASYIQGNSLVGMPAFWLHKNSAHIDYAPVYFVADADYYGYGTWMDLYHNGYGSYSGTTGTGGDSGSPAFMSLSNNPILLFATTLTPDAAGLFVSGDTNWNALAVMGLTNGMKILNISGYPTQSATLPTPDYNYIILPTNQVASSGMSVTFSVSISVFGTPPFTYQWQLNGMNLTGATNATLTVQAVAGNVGNYSVIVSNDLGSVTNSATLGIGPPPATNSTDTPLPLWANFCIGGLVCLVGMVVLKRQPHTVNI